MKIQVWKNSEYEFKFYENCKLLTLKFTFIKEKVCIDNPCFLRFQFYTPYFKTSFGFRSLQLFGLFQVSNTDGIYTFILSERWFYNFRFLDFQINKNSTLEKNVIQNCPLSFKNLLPTKKEERKLIFFQKSICVFYFFKYGNFLYQKVWISLFIIFQFYSNKGWKLSIVWFFQASQQIDCFKNVWILRIYVYF